MSHDQSLSRLISSSLLPILLLQLVASVGYNNMAVVLSYRVVKANYYYLAVTARVFSGVFKTCGYIISFSDF